MIRRFLITLTFILLGIASLVAFDQVHTWLCRTFVGFCTPYQGTCPGIDICTDSAWKTTLVYLFYLGPSVIFGVLGYTWSRQHRPIAAWVAAAGGLVILHSAVLVFITEVI